MNLPMILAESSVLSPLLVIVLCAVAAIGTVMVLPSRREAATRGIGGAVVAAAGVILVATLIRVSAGQNDPMGIYFWVFAAIAIASSFRVVTHTRPVYSALYFVLTVFASAGLFVLLWAEFMAAALVLIYAGAILVTYVFVIMLAAKSGSGGEYSECDQVSREPMAAAAVGFALMAVLLYAIFDKAPAALAQPQVAVEADLTVRGFARYLFESQTVNVILSAVLISMAMVGAIMIARKRIWNPEEPAAGDVGYKFQIGDDDPHSIPVAGTTNPRHKAYPEA